VYCSDAQYDDQLTTDDVSLAVLPMSHQFGIVVTICVFLTLGHQVIVMSRFSPNEYVRLVSKYKVSTSIWLLFIVIIIIIIIIVVVVVIIITIIFLKHVEFLDTQV